MRQILIFLLTFFTSTQLYSQSPKDEAQEFFKSIVKSYFSNGDKLLVSFNDSIVIINPSVDTLVPASSFDSPKDTAFFHNKLHNWTANIKTFENYLNKYYIKVYDKTEFIGKSNVQLRQDTLLNRDMDMSMLFPILHIFNKFYTDNDYLVVGSIPKLKSDNSIFGLYWMIVRKTKNGWKIFGVPN